MKLLPNTTTAFEHSKKPKKPHQQTPPTLPQIEKKNQNKQLNIIRIIRDLIGKKKQVSECHKAEKVHQHTGGPVSQLTQGLLYGKQTSMTLESERSVCIKTLETCIYIKL